MYKKKDCLIEFKIPFMLNSLPKQLLYVPKDFEFLLKCILKSKQPKTLNVLEKNCPKDIHTAMLSVVVHRHEHGQI